MLGHHRWRTALAGLGAGCFLFASAASATTIGFDGLDTDAPFTGYAQDGFAVAPVSGSWVGFAYGNPAPSIVFTDTQGTGGQASSIAVTRAGLAFTFAAIDLYSSLTPIPYAFRGTLGGQTVFTSSSIVPNTFGAFATVPSADAAAIIDRLEVTLSTVQVSFPNPYGIDNIVVSAAASAIPEPPSLWLLGSALAALAGVQQLERRLRCSLR